MGLLTGRTGLVFGIANHRSIAWGISEAAAAQGARLSFAFLNERMAKKGRPLVEPLEPVLTGLCDVSDDGALDGLFEALESALEGPLDFVVHSVAFADREDLKDGYSHTSRAGFATALDISAYSLAAIAKRAAPLMTEGGSVLSMSYYGAEKVVPNYNVMGIAKAALEASTRYLAAELGPQGIRVNSISAGPIKTLSAAGIAGFRDMLRHNAAKAPLRRNTTLDDVAKAAVFLLSDMGSGVTGEVLHVDCGYNILGM